MSDLSTKVRAIVFEETPIGHKWAYERVISEPPAQDLNQREEDLREWGYVYGLAYGIARGEDPYEANQDVAERAYQAAMGVFHDPTFSQLAVVRRFEASADAPAGR